MNSARKDEAERWARADGCETGEAMMVLLDILEYPSEITAGTRKVVSDELERKLLWLQSRFQIRAGSRESLETRSS